MTLFVTGGAGFIGSNFVLDWLVPSQAAAEPVLTLEWPPMSCTPQRFRFFPDSGCS